MSAPPDRAHILAALEVAQRAIDEVRAMLVAGDVAAVNAPPAASDDPEWATMQRAAEYCRVHPDTMTNRCRLHGLGWRVGGGMWRVDLARVRAWEEGRPYERLPIAFPKDSEGFGNVPNVVARRLAPK